MGKLIYSFFTSLDGCVTDEDGKFGWGEPDAEVHAFVNDLERSIKTHLYGRKLYETMAVWETPEAFPSVTEVILDYARIWKETDKVVFSRTLPEVTTARTRLEREFDAKMVRELKERSHGDLAVGGPTLAAEAIRAGLVDEYHLYLSPVVVGGGTPYWPRNLRPAIDLMEERRFGNGMVFLRYRSATR